LEPVEFHGLADKIPLLGIEVGEVETKCRKNRRLEGDIIFETLGILRCRLNVRSDTKSFRYTGTNGYFGGGGTGGGLWLGCRSCRFFLLRFAFAAPESLDPDIIRRSQRHMPLLHKNPPGKSDFEAWIDRDFDKDILLVVLQVP